MIPLRERVKGLGKVGVENINSGHIDRNRQGRVAARDPIVLPAAHRFPDKQVEVGNQSVLFENGNKDGGRRNIAVRLDPARQRLGAYDLARGGAALRLQIEHNFVAFHRQQEVGENVIFLLRAAVHGAVKYAYAAVKAFLGVARGEEGAVEHVAHLALGVCNADADGGLEAHRLAARGNQRRYIVVELFYTFYIIGAEHTKIVLPEIACHAAVFLADLTELGADLRHQQVAVAVAVPLVEQLEVLNVQRDEAPLHGAVFQHLRDDSGKARLCSNPVISF